MMDLEEVSARSLLGRFDFCEELLIGGQWVVNGDVALKIEAKSCKENFEIFLTFDQVFNFLGSFFCENKSPLSLIEHVVVDIGLFNVIKFLDHLIMDISMLPKLIVASLGSVSGDFLEVHSHEAFISFGNVLDFIVALIPFTEDSSELGDSWIANKLLLERAMNSFS